MLYALIVLALDFLVTAGLVWLGCWALGLMGFTIVWTWALAFGFWVLSKVLQIIFK